MQAIALFAIYLAPIGPAHTAPDQLSLTQLPWPLLAVAIGCLLLPRRYRS